MSELESGKTALQVGEDQDDDGQQVGTRNGNGMSRRTLLIRLGVNMVMIVVAVLIGLATMKSFGNPVAEMVNRTPTGTTLLMVLMLELSGIAMGTQLTLDRLLSQRDDLKSVPAPSKIGYVASIGFVLLIFVLALVPLNSSCHMPFDPEVHKELKAIGYVLFVPVGAIVGVIMANLFCSMKRQGKGNKLTKCFRSFCTQTDSSSFQPRWLVALKVFLFAFTAMMIMMIVFLLYPCFFAYGFNNKLFVTPQSISANWCAAPEQSSSKKTIAIIGAGMAGISAARDLSLMGHNVILLESRNRIGGRTFTDSFGYERGAQWIHFHVCNPLMTLVSEECFGIETRTQASFGEEEVEVNFPPDEEFDESACDETLERAECFAREDSTLTAREAFDLAAKELNLQGETLRQCNNTLRFEFDQFSGPYGDSSLQARTGLIPLGFRIFSGRFLQVFNDHILMKGYSELANKLFQNGDQALIDLRLSSNVTDVEYDKTDGVTITLEGGSTVQADRVIVAVPLGILKANRISFSPALEKDVQESIDRVGFGTFNKVWLEFPPGTTFDFDSLTYLPNQNEEEMIEDILDMSKQLGRPVLEAYTGGAAAQFIERSNSTGISELMMQTLRKKYPSLPDPIDIQFTQWGQDQHTLGSYSYFAANTKPDDQFPFTRPSPKQTLFFAGEHTIPYYFQTVHGAFLSGKRAAQAANEP